MFFFFRFFSNIGISSSIRIIFMHIKVESIHLLNELLNSIGRVELWKTYVYVNINSVRSVITKATRLGMPGLHKLFAVR